MTKPSYIPNSQPNLQSNPNGPAIYQQSQLKLISQAINSLTSNLGTTNTNLASLTSEVSGMIANPQSFLTNVGYSYHTDMVTGGGYGNYGGSYYQYVIGHLVIIMFTTNPMSTPTMNDYPYLVIPAGTGNMIASGGTGFFRESAVTGWGGTVIAAGANYVELVRYDNVGPWTNTAANVFDGLIFGLNP